MQEIFKAAVEMNVGILKWDIGTEMTYKEWLRQGMTLDEFMDLKKHGYIVGTRRFAETPTDIIRRTIIKLPKNMQSVQHVIPCELGDSCVDNHEPPYYNR